MNRVHEQYNIGEELCFEMKRVGSWALQVYLMGHFIKLFSAFVISVFVYRLYTVKWYVILEFIADGIELWQIGIYNKIQW